MTILGSIFSIPLFKAFGEAPKHPRNRIMIASISGIAILIAGYLTAEEKQQGTACENYNNLRSTFQAAHSIVSRPGALEFPTKYEPSIKDKEFRRTWKEEERLLSSFVEDHCASSHYTEDHCENIFLCLRNSHKAFFEDHFLALAKKSERCKEISKLFNQLINDGLTDRSIKSLLDMGIDKYTEGIDVSEDTLPLTTPDGSIMSYIEKPNFYLKTPQGTIDNIRVVDFQSKPNNLIHLIKFERQ